MVPEDLPEGAALSAPEPAAHDTDAAEPEAAEGAEGEVAEVVRDSWADLSEEALAAAGTTADSLGLGGTAAAQSVPESGEAAFGASADSPEEE